MIGQMIRQNKNIRGNRIGKVIVCLSQYVGYTVLLLAGSKKSLKSALEILFRFSKFSGLKPNISISITKVIWIGSKAQSSDTLCNDSGIH